MQQNEVLLTTNEAAKLEGVDYNTIVKRIQRGTLNAIKIEVQNHQGFEYRINLIDLKKNAQTKYYSRLKAETAEQLTLDSLSMQPQNYKDLTLLDLTDKQREEAAFWEKIVNDWQSFISDYHKTKTEKTKEFIKMFNTMNPDNSIAERTLRRKWELYRKYGIVALADDRRQGNRKGTTIGIADSTFSRWLNNDLPNPKKQNEKVDDFLEKVVRRLETQSASGIPFIKTGISEKILDVLEYCRIQKTIGCIYGDAGIGKTVTVKHWSEGKTDVIVIFASRAYRGEKAFLKVLARKIKTRVNGCMDDIFTDIVDELSKADVTIVIDEAQRLPLGTLEDIRDLNEITNTPIILVGNAEIYNKMLGTQKSEFAQLFSRIGIRSHLLTNEFTIEDMKMVFPSIEAKSQAYLLDVSKSKYGLRGAVNVYINSHNHDAVTESGLKAMAKLMGIIV